MTTQSKFFKGIYQFEDPSGGLVAAKVPAAGSVDLYNGTALIVRPAQWALFIYQGQLTDIFGGGTHQIKTENVPILTRLANWRFGFESPLQCELIFISNHTFTARRWGTPQPVMANFKDYGAVPIRSFGNFNVSIFNPKTFFNKIMGSRSTYSIMEIEEFIQGQIIELLPESLQKVKKLDELCAAYNALSKDLEINLNKEIEEFGLLVNKIQVLSALPSKEVLDAMEAKTAIQIIGSQKEYLLYKAAVSLGQANDGTGNDPLQMMMGLMLGKGLMGLDSKEKEKMETPALEAKKTCQNCQTALAAADRFCAHCGKKV